MLGSEALLQRYTVQRHTWALVRPSAELTSGRFLTPFLKVIGPIVGGFVAQNPKLGWRFNFWLMLILSAVNFVYGVVVTPETVRSLFLSLSNNQSRV